jgi:energy-coupling factor transport system ATP-binding protein
MLKSVCDNSDVSSSEPKEAINSPIAIQNKHLLQIDNLWFSYDNGHEVLKDISLTLDPTNFLVIMGENAAGKTTLLKSIRGLLRPSRGKIKIKDREVGALTVEALAGTVGYLAQNPNDYLFQPTVREEIAFTLQNLALENDTRIEDLLEKFALTRFAGANPRDLSTGERQRVALASILAADPPLIILDEPTRGLDYEMKEILGKLLVSLQQEGHAILVVTHDVEFAAEYATEILFLSRGQIVASGSKNVMLSRSTFYSSQIGKLFYQIDDSIVTLQDGEKALNRYLSKREE